LPTHRLISLGEREEWEQALGGVRHVFGHTWGSCSALSAGGDPVSLYVADFDGVRVACPLIEKTIEGRRDVATPYGFSGLTGTAPAPELPARWREFAAQRGYVAGYLAINPLFGDDSYVDPDTVTVVNDTFVLDLREGVDGAWGRLSTNRRRQLRGFELSRYEIDGDELSDFFVATYPQAMARKGAAERHRFGPETLRALCGLPSTFLVGARGEAGIESVSLFGDTPHAGDFLFNAALPGCAHHSVGLLWAGVHLLAERGVPWLNLGGGMSRGDSLADFKARFGATPLPMKAVKAVYDQAAYEDLCRCHGADPHDRSGFFPAYRNV
jgi:hypothetical protein